MRAAAKPDEDAEWFAWYNTYLQSDGWKRRRQMVLRRDEGICTAYLTGCTGTATEVHHLSYDMMRQGDLDAHQPLYQLRAVCAACHQQETAADRQRRNKLPRT